MALCTLVDRHTYTRPYGVTLQKVAIFLVITFEIQNFTNLGIGEFVGVLQEGRITGRHAFRAGVNRNLRSRSFGVPSTAVLLFGTGEISCAEKYQSWTEGVQQWVKGPSNTVRCSQETHGLFETECIER